MEKTNWLRIQWIEILLLHFGSLHALKWFHSPQCYWNILKKNSHHGFRVAKFSKSFNLDSVLSISTSRQNYISDIEQIEEELYRCYWKKWLLSSWAFFNCKNFTVQKSTKFIYHLELFWQDVEWPQCARILFKVDPSFRRL